MLLGSLLGPSKAVLDGLGTPKTIKNYVLFEGFANAGSWDFEALDGPLGAHLGPSWAHLGPKIIPKMAPNVVQKISKNLSKTS